MTSRCENSREILMAIEVDRRMRIDLNFGELFVVENARSACRQPDINAHKLLPLKPALTPDHFAASGQSCLLDYPSAVEPALTYEY